LSVEAVQDKFTCDKDTTLVISPVGAVGAVVSEDVTVTVACAVDEPELFVAVRR